LNNFYPTLILNLVLQLHFNFYNCLKFMVILILIMWYWSH